MNPPAPGEARLILGRARTAALGTLDPESGAPYVSLVNIAADGHERPIIFISRLAWHTRNLRADSRASLLISGPSSEGDALAASRLTVLGRFEEYTRAEAAPVYFAHHPEALAYAEFPDFGFWRLIPETVHCVSGFGRIQTMAAGSIFFRPGEQ